MAIEAGGRLGRYELVGLLGKGAMGAVYRGFDPLIQRTVAIKTISHELLDEGGEQARTRFRNEARAGGRLNHPSIVGVYEFGEEGGLAYIAMEFVEGVSLREILREKGKMGLSDAVGVVLQVLDGLVHAHEQGVVHRDIKPPNLIVTPKGRIKITDFGVARIESSSLTQVGMLIGTPSYMPPEQFLGKGVDARSDLYAVGVLLFELLCGRRPFEGGLEALAHRICSEAPPRLVELESGVPEGIDAVVRRALEKLPEQRFQSAGEFSRAVQAAFAAIVPGTGVPRISDETVVLASRVRPVLEPGRQPGTAGVSLSGQGAAWQDSSLQDVERQLASFIGPLAKLMVRRAAAGAASLDALYETLARSIDVPADRAAFLARVAQGSKPESRSQSGLVASPPDTETARPQDAPAVGGEARPITPESLEAATRVLAHHLGPIARVMVRRCAERCSSWEALIGHLANELPEAERPRFLAQIAREVR